MKHLIALIATALAIAAIVFMINLDKEANKFQEIQKVIAKSKQEVKLSQVSKPIEDQTQEKDENEEKLKALKEKAGNLAAFDVSPMYKRKCSSCHGVNGEGIIGPKLIGRTKEFVLKNLRDFKSGKRKNYVMFGLLNNMKDEDLVTLATEIGTFEEKMKNSNK